MKEKKIIEGKPYSLKKIVILAVKIGIIYNILMFLFIFLLGIKIEWTFETIMSILKVAIAFIVLFIILSLIIQAFVFQVRIIVTDKRVYGKTVFCKRVDLPLDSISSIGSSMFAGISVATSSGKISFLGIDNRDEIYDEISKLLLERQERKNNK